MFLTTLLASVKWYPVLFDSPINAVRATLFWLTVAIVIAVAIAAICLKDKRKRFFRFAFPALIGYAAVAGILLLVFTLLDDGILTILFVPLLVLVVAVAGSSIALCIRKDKPVLLAAGIVVGAAVIATLVCIGIYYAQAIKDDGYYNSDAATVNQIWLYVCAVLLIAVIVALGFLFGRKDKKGFDSKSIAYAAVCIAMSFALSYLRILRLPQGGSITVAALLPLMIYAYMFGTKKGVFAGLIYGVLQAVQDPYIIHPAQFLLDYPVAFSAIGLAGMFAKCEKLNKLPQVQFALGAIVASTLRFVCHVLSGVFAFSAYAVDAGMNAWVYSLAYNSFVFADIAIVIVAGVLVLSSPTLVKEMRKHNVQKSLDNAQEK